VDYKPVLICTAQLDLQGAILKLVESRGVAESGTAVASTPAFPE
jgi:hypothetical protein